MQNCVVPFAPKYSLLRNCPRFYPFRRGCFFCREWYNNAKESKCRKWGDNLRDSYGREINYLRISVTDRCNLRCRYCMPSEGVAKKRHQDMLSLEHLHEIAQAAVALGVRKIRLTGGEPLVRRGVVGLVEALAEIPGVEDLSMTTNGILLPQFAPALKAAGLKRLNLSLDTLHTERYAAMTRLGRLEDAWAGFEAALTAGFSPIKVNAVLIGGFNNDEIPDLVGLTERYPIEMRFIELMPMGHTVFPPEAYLPVDRVLEAVPALSPLPEDAGTARLYQLPGAPGRVGLISPLSQHFCGSCNRIRLTADGFLKPCLHGAEEISVAALHGAALMDALRTVIAHKPPCHDRLAWDSPSKSIRTMNEIGG